VMEKEIREKAAGAELEAAMLRAAAALDPLIAQLRAVFRTPASGTPAPAAPLDPAKAREAAGRLAGLFSYFDPDSVDFAEANRTVLQPLFAAARWSDFEKLVQGFAFEEARAQLEQALKTLPPV